MALDPRNFNNVYVYILYENGSKVNKYSEPISVLFESEPRGIFCKLKKGKTLLLEIILDNKTDCCKLGQHSYIFNCNHEDLMLTFASKPDQVRFHDQITKVREGRDVSVFSRRTDESSATQYFQFYSYLSQQQNMMQDYVRTGTYQRAILSNLSDFKDKIVLDVGAGSGILSFFAAQAGAKRVYAVEASSMSQHCEALVKANYLEDTIKVISGKIEEIDICECVDIIISEPMGYMLYNERMLETYIHAKKWLSPGGKMFPSTGDLHIAPFYDEALYYEQLNKANFWYQNCFHGVDLSHLRESALSEYLRQPIVDTFDIEICLAKSIRYSLDFLRAKESDLYDIKIPLEFYILKSSMLHGLAFWFDVAFIGSTQTVWLSTAPNEPLTHWYQVRCLLEKPVFVKQGQLVGGTVELLANRRQSYDVIIDIHIEGTCFTSKNTLDLKNPYFRYTGAPVQPPPGQNTVSPSEAYWQQVDAQGAKQAVNIVNGITVNGMGEVAMEPGSASLINLGTGNISMVNVESVAPLIGNQRMMGIGQPEDIYNQYSPMNAQPNNQMAGTSAISVVGGNFPVNNALMIGDYVTPGSLVLPTQGIHLGGPPIPHHKPTDYH